MIINSSNFKPYFNLSLNNSENVLYQSIITDFSEAALKIALCLLTRKIFSFTPSHGLKAVIFANEKDELYGSILFLSSDMDVGLSLNNIVMYESFPLPFIYKKIKRRLNYGLKIKKELKPISALPLWEQCPDNFNLLNSIGNGTYGAVYKALQNDMLFAVKMSKIKPEAVSSPFDTTFSSWREVYILESIINPIVYGKKCPNLPLLYGKFTCKERELLVRQGKIKTNLVITAVELANGTLEDYLSVKRDENQLYCCLFQILAGLHAIQKYGQIMNFDIKTTNILYYEVEKGGFWQYTIRNKNYYIPNLGFLFVLNDFGISRSMSPSHPMHKDGKHRLGSRFGKIENGKIVPVNEGSDKFTLNKKQYLGREYILGEENNINFDPEIYPPFEFYNDTQDVIKMFVGGKKSTQQGEHQGVKNTVFVKALKPYIGPGHGFKEKKFNDNPATILAGFLIEKLFGNYTVKKNNIIEKYIMN